MLSYLYRDNISLAFMDPKNFEQFMVPANVVGEAASFLVEGQEVWMLFWEEEPLEVEIPPKVTLEIVEASPGVRGDTVAGATKDAVVSSGLHIRVPLFINQGDWVVVDTRTGKYVERKS